MFLAGIKLCSSLQPNIWLYFREEPLGKGKLLISGHQFQALEIHTVV